MQLTRPIEAWDQTSRMKGTSSSKIHLLQTRKDGLHFILSPFLLRSRSDGPQIVPRMSIRAIGRRDDAAPKKPHR